MQIAQGGTCGVPPVKDALRLGAIGSTRSRAPAEASWLMCPERGRTQADLPGKVARQCSRSSRGPETMHRASLRRAAPPDRSGSREQWIAGARTSLHRPMSPWGSGWPPAKGQPHYGLHHGRRARAPEARDERRLLPLQKPMVACKLLIIDELGFVRPAPTDLAAYERGATLITSARGRMRPRPSAPSA